MLTEEAMPLTAFPTHLGLLEYIRMPFGLVCAVATYIYLMRIVLRGITNVAFYLDNIWICSPSWDDHLRDVRAVLDRLNLHGLAARPSKCSFGVSKINYLGNRISRNSLSVIPDKVSALTDLSPPTSKKGLRSVLELLSFYRKFIPDNASLSSSLTDMTRKKVTEPLVWSETALLNFQTMKTILSTFPVLCLPDASKPFVLCSDASATALEAVLLQYDQELAHPIAYASSKLLDRETRYSTIERECLATIHGVSKNQYYLLGREFILEVDQKPIVYLHKLKNSNRHLMRWALALQPFKFRIVHIPGSDNIGADLLSRY